jgi:hypothetical protein
VSEASGGSPKAGKVAKASSRVTFGAEAWATLRFSAFFFFPHLVFLWFSQTSGFLKFSDFVFFFDF